MIKNKFNLILVLVLVMTAAVLPSCRKGTDDPAVSFKSRENRITNSWNLVKYEKNATTQDLNGTTYEYVIYEDGKLKRTVEGTVFGFPTRTVSEGTWTFQNDDEDVKIVIGTDTTLYNIQRLATDELWLKNTQDSDTYIYYFESI
ncbi:MAG TPA: hypothetical protein DIW47_14860 [Bacteroidetes bacterium]|nr:hypothetical protein [Bacteroidota bacterium]